MKSFTLFILGLLGCVQIGLAQNALILDLKAKTITGPARLDFGNNISVSVSVPDEPARGWILKYILRPGASETKKSFATGGSIALIQGTDLPNPAAPVNFVMNIYNVSTSRGYEIIVNSNGTYAFGNPVFSSFVGDMVYDDHKFSNINPGIAGYKSKYPNLIIYYPCDNTWEIFRNGRLKNSLKYYGSPNNGKNGAVFLVHNFNTIKYDVSASSTFVSSTTEIPDLFSSIGTIISGAAAAQAAVQPVVFPDFVKLNKSLKSLLSQACGDFPQAKQSIVDYISQRFNNDIAAAYKDYKTSAIAPPVTQAAIDALNKTNHDDNHLNISADSLVKEDIALSEVLKNTSFNYQSNIIQLQNADQLQFTINISPKKDSNGISNNNSSLNIVNQTLNIPIIGGWKFDFSTGFYYSTKKNEMFTLRPNQTGDTSKSSIIKDANFKGGTAGINALLNAYYRYSDWVTTALSIGAGKSLNLNYSLLLGASVYFNAGGQNKIGVSYGFNFANIKTVSSSQRDDSGAFIPQAKSVTSVNYVNKFVTGRFISLTYTFGLNKSSQSGGGAAASGADSEKK